MIPFSPPRIDQAVIDEVTAALKSGWITTGPRTKQFEKEISAYCGAKTTIAVSSWTTGMEVMLRWWGVGPGDEVIIHQCPRFQFIFGAGSPEDFFQNKSHHAR